MLHGIKAAMQAGRHRLKTGLMFQIIIMPATEAQARAIHVAPANKTTFILTRMAMFNARIRAETGRIAQTQAGNGSNRETSPEAHNRTEMPRHVSRDLSARVTTIQTEAAKPGPADQDPAEVDHEVVAAVEEDKMRMLYHLDVIASGNLQM